MRFKLNKQTVTIFIHILVMFLVIYLLMHIMGCGGAVPPWDPNQLQKLDEPTIVIWEF